LTDGLIPTTALKYFRFRGEKAVKQLMTSCGVKADGETAYAPLWEPHSVGYKMHDYLEHNDCRDAILARMERADQRRLDERDRKAEWRSKKDAKRARHESAERGTETDLSHGTGTGQSHGTVRSTTQHNTTSTSTSANADVARASRAASIQGRMRPNAAWQGPRGLYVLQTQHQQFVESRNGDEPAVLAFYGEVAEVWGYGVMKDANIDPNQPRFWNARFAEKWPPAAVTAATSRSTEPEWARKARERKAAEAQL
jgi:hypothetical protein